MTRPAKTNRPPSVVLSSPFGMGGTTPMPDLDDLADVTAPSPADGDVLVWDDGASAWVPASVGATIDLDDLADVDTSGVTDGQVIVWDAGTSTWVPADAATPPALDAAGWLPLTTVVAGDPVLVWDGDDGLIPTLVPF